MERRSPLDTAPAEAGGGPGARQPAASAGAQGGCTATWVLQLQFGPLLKVDWRHRTVKQAEVLSCSDPVPPRQAHPTSHTWPLPSESCREPHPTQTRTNTRTPRTPTPTGYACALNSPPRGHGFGREQGLQARRPGCCSDAQREARPRLLSDPLGPSRAPDSERECSAS